MFEVKSIPIEQIKPYPQNAKKHPDRQIELLAKQIADGFDQPIVVDKDMVIIKGHGRLLASKKLGLKSVPVIVRDDLTDSQVKAARIADNKLAETDWDMDLLAQELESIQDNIMLDDLGFNQEELERLLDGFVGDASGFGGDEIEDAGMTLKTAFKIEIDCDNESDQESLYNELTSRGLSCRLLTL